MINDAESVFKSRKRSVPVTAQQQKPFNGDLEFTPDHKIDYDEFAQLLTTSPKLLGIIATTRVLPPPDLEALSASIVKISSFIGSTSFMLDVLLNIEFDRAYSSSQSVILRGNSLATKAMDHVIHITTIDYLKRVLLEPLKRVLVDESLSLEVDKTKMLDVESESEKQKLVEQNLDLLKQHSSIFLDAMLSDSALEEMPYLSRSISRTIRNLSEEYNFDPVPLIGSYIMLRLFNPSIVFPEARKILPSQVVVDTRSRRNLTLITKVVQNISNSVDFGSKEAYMIPMNTVIEQYKSKCRKFLLDTCVDEGTSVMKQIEFYKIVQDTRDQKLLSLNPDMRKEIEGIHTLLAKNKDRIVKNINELQISEDLANDLVNVLSRLPALTPITMKKPLPPVPKQEETQPPPDKKYTELLEKAHSVKDIDLEAMNILTIKGTDKDGRPIVVFSEERVKKDDLDRVLLYIIKKLDKVVEKDYVMIWCVNNSSNQSRPGFQWFLNVYRSLSRKYKKNLKSFYLIHPTFIFKMIIKCFRPFVSEKFWKKLHLCDRVSQVYNELDRDSVALPPSVLSYDFLLNKDNTQDIQPVYAVPLAEIMERPENKGQKLPKFLGKLFDHIRMYGLDAQGLFRVPGNVTEVQKLKLLLNNNDNIDFCHCDIHTVGTTLKQFFREMPEPLLSYELYSEFLHVLRSDDNNPIANYSYVEPVKGLLERLPNVNYLVARELFALLVAINEQNEVNKMNSHNLAIVFGPNILRSKNEDAFSALQDNVHITRVVDFMITEFNAVFASSAKNRTRPTNVRFSTANFMEQFIHDDQEKRK